MQGIFASASWRALHMSEHTDFLHAVLVCSISGADKNKPIEVWRWRCRPCSCPTSFTPCAVSYLLSVRPLLDPHDHFLSPWPISAVAHSPQWPRITHRQTWGSGSTMKIENQHVHTVKSRGGGGGEKMCRRNDFTRILVLFRRLWCISLAEVSYLRWVPVTLLSSQEVFQYFLYIHALHTKFTWLASIGKCTLFGYSFVKGEQFR